MEQQTVCAPSPLAAPLVAEAHSLAPDEAATLVAQLKAEADRHWMINARRSLELAELIVQIGEARGERQHVALGMMARGDALKLLGRAAEAWEALDEAGRRFEALGDDVGWARTRIGRLLICVDLGYVAEALADAERARAILAAAGALDKLLVLDINTAVAHHLLGEYRQALERYSACLELALAEPEIGAPWLGSLRINLGYLYDLQGDFPRALEQYALGRAHCEHRGEVGSVAAIDLNRAHIAMAQGQYRQALRLLNQVHSFYSAAGLANDATVVDADRVECYLLLNRYAEARELGRQVCAALREASTGYWEALSLLHLAMAEAALGDPAAAGQALDAAEASFIALGSVAWVATTRLRRSKIALLAGDLAVAAREAYHATEAFAASGRQVDHAEARLLLGAALLRSGQAATAGEAGRHALRVARRCHVPQLRYSAHLHNGRVAAALGNTGRARRSFQAAVATLVRAQQGLTLHLRPGFLEDKGEATHALMDLYLREGQHAQAFRLLEQGKAQVLLSYIANRDLLRWPADDPQALALRAELDELRAAHHGLSLRAHGRPAPPDEQPPGLDVDGAHQHMMALEQRLRAVTEQLNLLSGDQRSSPLAPAPSLVDVQARLGVDEALVEYYTDGHRLWAFTLSGSSLAVTPLAASPAQVAAALERLQLNLRSALLVGPEAPLSRRLLGVARSLLHELWCALLAPLAPTIDQAGRLLIVPYGLLHAAPFHLLHDGVAHLIERCEVVILPAAGLLARRVEPRPRGSLALAHDHGGALPHTADEALAVRQRFGGQYVSGRDAVRGALAAPPTQILHIAAHGEQRLDLPDRSFITLADGQLYADDLLQHDLSYELVTLSACETGRSVVVAGDEPIGLGRGILYAGAGALIASMWRVADGTTAALMESLYKALEAGAGKASALRAAQLALRAAQPELHPAFWGPFQLIGDSAPLSRPQAQG